MKYTIQHNFNDWPHFYVSTFFNNLYDQLQKRYENHTFEIINYPEYDDYGYGSIYSCMNFSIINSKTEKYALVSFFDNWKYHFMKHIGWKPEKMVKFFYPGGFNYLDNPATTSTTTYKVRGLADSCTSYWQYDNGPSTITLMEIGA